jgi:hypothetical protein
MKPYWDSGREWVDAVDTMQPRCFYPGTNGTLKPYSPRAFLCISVLVLASKNTSASSIKTRASPILSIHKGTRWEELYKRMLWIENCSFTSSTAGYWTEFNINHGIPTSLTKFQDSSKRFLHFGRRDSPKMIEQRMATLMIMRNAQSGNHGTNMTMRRNGARTSHRRSQYTVVFLAIRQ